MHNFTITHIGDTALTLPLPFIYINAAEETKDKPFIFQANDGTSEGSKQSLEIKFAQPYYICAYQCTQEFWQLVAQYNNNTKLKPNPSHFKGLHRPVEQVSWNDIQIFNQELNLLFKNEKVKIEKNKFDEITFGLPSETQWEYAAKAGSNYVFAGSQNPNDVAWYDKNSNKQTQIVGCKQPNTLGLYDMSGNVWEWCADDYIEDKNKIPKDGNPNTQKDKYNSLRGGGYYNGAIYCRACDRNDNGPHYRNGINGFRLAGFSFSVPK